MKNSGSFTADNETILRECEAVEIERLFMHTSINFVDYKLCHRVYDRVIKRFGSNYFAIAAVYLMGYIYGIRAERKRRKAKTMAKGDYMRGTNKINPQDACQ